MITFQREALIDIWTESLPLMYEHWEEMSHHGPLPFDPDQALYLRLEACGGLRVFTVRQEGVLVGYACFIVGPSFWHKGKTEAHQHSLYLTPKARGHTGVKFLKWLDRELATEAQICHQHTHTDRAEHKLFERLGYETIHYELEKLLGD